MKSCECKDAGLCGGGARYLCSDQVKMVFDDGSPVDGGFSVEDADGGVDVRVVDAVAVDVDCSVDIFLCCLLCAVERGVRG